MSKSKTLTVAQLLVLTTAAQRPDHMILPLPPTIRVRGGAQRSLLGTLLKMALVEEVTVDDAAIAWRADEAGQHLGLRMTAAGLAASGADVSANAAAPPGASTQETAAHLPSPMAQPEAAQAPPAAETGGDAMRAISTPSGKLGQILTAIGAPQGATLRELVAQTGWLPHTTRAAVTRLRQRGHPIRLVTSTDRKAYHLAADVGMAADASAQP